MTTDRYPLGRVKQHDPRSLMYAHGVLPKSAILPVAWTRRVLPFDQLDLGSCTGNAAAGLLATDCKQRVGLASATILDYGGPAAGLPDPALEARDTGRVTVPVDEDLAVRIYGLATQLDEFSGQYPPTDTGSSGLGAAKALQKLGLASRYTHALGGPAAVQSGLQDGPGMAGTVWLESMFETDDDGFVIVDRKSRVAGGHEYEVFLWTPGEYRMWNSWGPGWGSSGVGRIKEDDFHWLLAQDGDMTFVQWSLTQPRTVTNQQMYDAQKAAWTTTQAWGSYKGLKL